MDHGGIGLGEGGIDVTYTCRPRAYGTVHISLPVLSPSLFQDSHFAGGMIDSLPKLSDKLQDV